MTGWTNFNPTQTKLSGDAKDPSALPAALPDNTGELQATRFRSGVSGNPKGRPKGAKNKLTELFLKTLVDDFALHGMETLAKLRKKDPAAYLKIIETILPRDLIQQYEEEPDIDYATLTHEEATALLEEVQRRQCIKKAIKSIQGS